MNAQQPEPVDIVAAVVELVAELRIETPVAPDAPPEWRQYRDGYNNGIRAAGDYVGTALRLLLDDVTPATDADAAVLQGLAQDLAAARAQRTEPAAPALRLLRHDRAAVPTVTTVAEGHPPIPGVLEVLRAVIAGIGCRPVSDVSWWHRSHTPWGAVVGLHCRGEHHDATALARLLAWCDAQSPDMADPIVWEITTPEPVAVPVAPHAGAATTTQAGGAP